MIRHVFLLKFAPEAKEDDIAALVEHAQQLPAAIPAIRSFWSGLDQGLNEINSSFAIIADFDDEAGWREFMDAPVHKQFSADYVNPVRGSGAAIQINV